MSGLLVIGASGFLGQHLMRCCSEIHKVGTYYLNASPGLHFLDLQNNKQITEMIERVAPSVVIYAAGLTDVDACEMNPELAWQLNAYAVAKVASYSSARVVYLSTDYVFDGLRGLYSEDDEPRPINIYGQTKVAGERSVLGCSPKNIVVRVSGLYDSYGIRGRAFSNPLAPVIDDDARLSSPVHVDDVVSAIQLLLTSDTGGIYHVAGPDVLSRYEFWQLVSLRYPRKAVQPERHKTVGLRPRDSSLSTLRMKSLGWKARPVCRGLPPLETIPRPFQSSSTKDNKADNSIEAILIDCVGGLLTRRTWHTELSALAEVDRSCANAMDGPEFWRTVAYSLGLDESDVPNLQEQVAFRYAPNPSVWDLLRRYHGKYKLALVNNGASATFRRWVQKYGLDQVFDVLANSEEMGVRKPDPEFFFRVAKELRTRCERCVLIDDDERNIRGARMCGLSTIQTYDRHKYPLSIHEWDHALASELLSEDDLNG